MKFSRIVKAFAEKANLSLEEGLDKAYNSKTFMLMDQGIADMHCMSDIYLTEELLMEYGYMKRKN